MTEERQRAARWKTDSPELPAAARLAAPYLRPGQGDTPYPFCLPAEFAALNPIEVVRDSAITLFSELGIPWHAGVAGGPSNHLLSSQVQCVNALMPMVTDADRIKRAFGDLLDVAEVLEIEPGRLLTFEFIGARDWAGEGAGNPRTRGTHCTSVDAAFRYRTSAGAVELALVEWKYTESYSRSGLEDPGKNAVRYERYRSAFFAPDGPLRTDVVEYEDLFVEPFYQLIRQQLLARDLERQHELGADVVRVVHVSPAGNLAYQQSVPTAALRAVGTRVSEVWQQLLRRPDRFVALDSQRFLDPQVSGYHYAERYGDPETLRPEDHPLWRDELGPAAEMLRRFMFPKPGEGTPSPEHVGVVVANTLGVSPGVVDVGVGTGESVEEP